MKMPIISTKIHLPAVPQAYLPRPELIARLDAALGVRLILVSAPAGFGKSTLLAEWVERCRDANLVSWVHLDQSDNDPVRFMSYVIASLQTQREDFGEAALAGLLSAPPAPMEAVLASLVNEIDELDRSLLLILDDYHLIEMQEIHAAVGFLLEHAPSHLHLVLATRADPPLPLHKLRAQGELVEIRTQDLRFSREETRKYIEKTLKSSLADNDLSALDNRIEGWIAGLQMAVLSLRDKENTHEFVASFSGSHRFIMDYLTEEIYNQQPPHIQAFLLKTSILSRLSGPLCEYVLESEPPMQERGEKPLSAQQTLEFLEQANLFLLALDDERHWYRYHQLFSDLLHQRLRQIWPDQVVNLQLRASEWFAANGYIDEALDYAHAADDIQRAVKLVEKHGMELLKRGALANLSGWFRKLPGGVIAARPWLSILFSWVLLLSAKPGPIEDYLSSAEKGARLIDDTASLGGHVAAIRAYLAARNQDVDSAIEQAKLAREMLPKGNLSARSVVSFILGGVYYLQGGMPQALEAMKEAARDGERSGNVHVAVSALSSAASILVSQGKLSEGEEAYNRALKLGTSPSGQSLPITASVYGGVARLHLARNDLRRAKAFASFGLELGEKWLNPDSQVGCLLVLAQVAQSEGNSSESQNALKRARHLAAISALTPGTEENINHVASMIQAQKAGGSPRWLLVEPLSERELEVLRLISEGCSNAEIAERLIIAIGTVKAHTSSIYRKLDVSSRTEAVVKARDLGLI